MKRISILLIVVALIVGMVGCEGNGGISYTLTVSSTIGGSVTISSTTGGNVTIPGEGIYNYPAGVAVVLMAEPAEGYSFAYWSGDVSTIIDVNAATTILAMYGDYSITANFVQGRAIRTWYDLDEIRYYPSGDWVLVNNLDYTTSGYAQLAGSLANDGKGWSPIGTAVNFTGVLDGQGYEIHDLCINRNDTNVGLFSLVGEGAIIKNVGVVNADVTGKQCVGILVGENSGAVYNAYATGNLTGQLRVGGLMGKNRGTVSDSYSIVNGSSIGYSDVGGLVAANSGNISNSYAAGDLNGGNTNGGLVGWNNGGTITNSFWDKTTSGCNWSDGGIGKTTTEMMDITTFSDATWDIAAVANPSARNLAYIWNIVDDETYPFLSWE